MSDPRGGGPSDAERLARLEAVVADLAERVAELGPVVEKLARAVDARDAPRAPLASRDTHAVREVELPPRRAPEPALAAPAPPPASLPASPPSAPPSPPPWRPTLPKRPALDLESLVGRYGTMLLGGLTILLGVGAFLRWAIERVTIGPEMRVALGAAGAAALGGLGLWLRERDGGGTRRFGSVLLAIALAMVHVVTWGAGPALGVISDGAALAVAAVASAALAALAWRAVEQALFVVGVGGALLAPFVTAAEGGDPALLLIYGWVVLAAAVAALRERAWPWAARVCTTAVLAYVGVALDASWTGGLGDAIPWMRRVGPGLFVLACAWATLLWGGRAHRSSLTRAFLLILVLPLLARATITTVSGPHPGLLLLTALGAVTLYAALRLRDARQPYRAASAFVQPLLFLCVALLMLRGPVGVDAATVCVAAALLALLAALDAGFAAALRGDANAASALPAAPSASPDEAPWRVHLLVAALASALGIALGLEPEPVLAVMLLAGHAAGMALLARRVRAPLLLASPLLVLAVATLWALYLLRIRVPYEYPPFLTLPSLAALAVVAGWAVVGRAAAAAVTGAGTGPTERAVLRSLGLGALVLWGREELARAFSPDLATFLLVAYFAVVGVLLILVGRRRGIPGGRRIGLGLAVYAALLAITQASDFEAVGLRVGSYLLVGGFLLAVAYWYRAAGEEERDTGSASPAAPQGSPGTPGTPAGARDPVVGPAAAPQREPAP